MTIEARSPRTRRSLLGEIPWASRKRRLKWLASAKPQLRAIVAMPVRRWAGSVSCRRARSSRRWTIGCQNAAHIAETALASGQTLKEAALASGHVDEQQFDALVDPRSMVGEGVTGA